MVTEMNDDAFSKYHPAVNLIFFVGAVCCGVLLQHPIYLLAGLLASTSYYLLLHGRNGIKMIAAMIPLFIFITFLNPVINTRGVTVLFTLFGRPYTSEALIYGVVVATIFVVMMLWLGCYNKVLTGDKFTCLFGNIMPAIALLLVMVFRMIPVLLYKAKQITDARSTIGKGIGLNSGIKDKLTSGITVLGVLISWALEGSVTTGDSMRSRGYASSKRTSFMIYRLTGADWIMIVVMLALLGVIICFAAGGYMHAEFFPERSIASINASNVIGFISYLGFLMIPTILHIKETVQWSISKCRI